MDDELEQLLATLNLRTIGDVLERELSNAQKRQVSYTIFLKRLLRQERDGQVVRAMEYRIRRSRLPERWSLGTFPWAKQLSLERRVIEQLAELNFVTAAENIVLIGDTGTGKTGIASALLLQALKAGYRGLFIKAQDLFDEMYASLADRSSRKLVTRLSRIDVLLIDEMGYLNLRPEQTNIFFKLMEERYGRKATIITTNLGYEQWPEFLGNKSMVQALLDRLRHHCHTLRIEGPSLREPRIQ
ncbi:MAG: IS21-like element helper ATPase IstB [Myxococcales bacterium]|nr:IS21-like element helper ATPase IstB [Myxococcales bacterium]